MKGESIDFLSLVCSFIFGVIFVPLVIIRLPVFKSHYTKDINSFESKYNDMPNQKAAPVLCGLVTALVLAIFFHILGFENYWLSCFCGCVASGIISFYYEP